MKNLVLTRKKGDSIILQKDDEQLCKVTVTHVGLKQVKLAFEADSSVIIDREEVYNLKNKT
jgi:carbon storage regulator CsrA